MLLLLLSLGGGGLVVEEARGVGGSVFAWGYNSFGECNVPGGLSEVVEVACGNYFSIALKSDGTLAAWGDNSWGLANFPAAATNIMAISTRGFDCLALRRDGTLVVWGDNSQGQANIPAGATGIVAIATGGGHHLALRQDGALFAWGANNYGQCNIPVEATNVVAIAAGYTHSLVLRKDGRLFAWGQDTSGDTDLPPGATNIVAISAGQDFNLALRADGALFAWGLDWGGNLPVPADATNIVAISAGQLPDFVVRSDGSVVAWGRNDNGELDVPPGLAPAFSIWAGDLHSLGIRVTGGPAWLRQPADRIVSAGDTVLFDVPAIGQVPLAYQWRFNGAPIPGETSPVLLLPSVQLDAAGGYDVVVQNGFGSITSAVAQVTVQPAAPAITLDPTGQAVSLGGQAVFGLQAKGSAPLSYQWLHNGQPLPGATKEVLALSSLAINDSGGYQVVVTNYLGAATSASAPLEVVPVFAWGLDQTGVLDLPFGLTNVVAVAAGLSHNLALKADGSVVGWGDNSYGEAAPLATTTNVQAIAAGDQFSLVLRADGEAVAWGNTMTAPATATNLAAISAGIGYSLVLDSNGTASAWGWVNTPSPPPAATNLVAVAAGSVQSLGLYADGTLLGWGNAATPPVGVSNVMAIAAGDGFSLALHNDGTLLAWGINTYGQTNIPAAATNIIAVAAKSSTAMALREDGQVMVWGNTNSGQGAFPPGLTFASAIAVGQSHCLAFMDLGPLRFSRPPSAQTVSAGDGIALAGIGTGAGPIRYQWKVNGTNLAGATHAYLTLNDVQAANAAAYQVVISNSQGSLTSSVATLTVTASGPAIVNQPTNRVAAPGQTSVFTASAKGSEPLFFQWFLDGSGLADQTNSSLSLADVQVTNSGNYQVVITNLFGAATSQVARLDVYPLNLQTTLTNALGSWTAAWADFDNDGRLDLLVGGKAGGQPLSATAHLFWNDGAGGLVETNIGLNQSVFGVSWADFDNHGALDILLTTFSGANIYRNNGDGTFSNLNLTLAGDYGTAATIADFDRDGKPDILLGGRLYRNLGGNRFTNVIAGLPSIPYGCTAWGDYDKDGWPDLLVCGLVGGGTPRVQLYRNLGNGTFTNVVVGFTNLYRGAVAWLDFDGDGNLDALVSGQSSAGAAVTMLYRNNGDGTFTNVPCNLPPLSYVSMAVADFDNDGYPDVFLSGNNGSANVGSLYHGLTNGLFTPVNSLFPTNLASSAAWGDYDRDGRLDLALTLPLAGGQTAVGVYRNGINAPHVPPVAPGRLAASAFSSSIRFAWSAGSGGPPGPVTYNVRVGRNTGGVDVLAPNSDPSGLRRLATPGNAGGANSLLVTNIPFGQYYWSVQVVDGGFAGSPFTPEQVFTYAGYTRPPTNVTSSTATLLGSLTANGMPTIAFFEWGSDTNLGTRTPVQNIAATATNTTVSAGLAGLLPGTGYSYRLVVSNALALAVGANQSFLTLDLPQITTLATTKVSATGATLNASVNPSGSATVVYFQYGLTTAYGATSLATNLGGGFSPVPVSLPITGLIGGQVFHYQVVASNSVGISSSPDLTFTTTDEPEVTTLAASSVGPVSALLNASVRANTLSTWASFEYGLTTNYGGVTPWLNIGAGTNLVPVNFGITNLTRLTTYHFRAVATNTYAATRGADRVFVTTNDVIALGAIDIGMTNATLTGLANPNGAPTWVVFEYGLSTNYGSLTLPMDLGAGTNLSPFAVTLPGLVSGSNYYFRVVATNQDGVRFSAGTGFQTLPQFSLLNPGLPGAVNGTLAWGDYDNDGKLDMLVSDANSTRLYRNLGGGTFALVNTAIPGVASGTAVWGDYDNDGRLDILLTGTSSQGPITRIYRNNGDGTFTDINAGLPAVAFRTAAWGDFDNDGRSDVLLVGDTNSVGLTLIYRNNGDGTFTNLPTSLPGFLDATAVCADYDNDGRLDVLLTGRVGIEYANVFSKLFHNDGHGLFHEVAVPFAGVRLGYADWGDYDGDGYLDLILGGQGTGLGPTLKLYHNNGDGTFSDTTSSLPQFAPDAVNWGDYDNDGRPDLLIRGQQFISSVVPPSSYSALFHNQGDGTFAATNLPLPEIWSSCGGWADYDNDGFLDFVISGNSRSGPLLMLYQNNTPGSVALPPAPTNLVAAVSANSVQLSWDQAVAGPSAGSLTYNVSIGTTISGNEVLSPLSATNGTRRVVGRGNAGAARSLSVYQLAPGTYFWSVQALSPGFAGSPFAAAQTFTIAAPPPLLTASLLPLHTLQLQFTGTPGQVYHVLASSNLVNWLDVGAASNASSNRFIFLDGLGTNFLSRFYRVTGF